MGFLDSVSGPVSSLIDIGGSFIQNDWNKRSVQRQMDFQKDMSDSAIRRRMADLKAAGLNPMLAYDDGASSPSGGSYSAGPVAQGFSSSVRDSQRISMEKKELMGRLDLQKAQSEAAKAAATRELSSAKLLDAQFFEAAKQNEFIQQNPNYIPIMKWMQAIGSGVGTARDLAIGYRGLKGFENSGETTSSDRFGSKTKKWNIRR